MEKDTKAIDYWPLGVFYIESRFSVMKYRVVIITTFKSCLKKPHFPYLRLTKTIHVIFIIHTSWICLTWNAFIFHKYFEKDIHWSYILSSLYHASAIIESRKVK